MKAGRLSKPWKWGLGAAALAVCAVAVAVLVGYTVWQSKHRDGAQVDRVADWGTTNSSAPVQHTQLPAPESAEADAILADNNTPSWITDLYTFQRDSAIITADLTGAWLQLLQRELFNSPGSADQRKLDLQPFIRVAADILGYLRYNRSKLLLQLLRDFAATGNMDLESVDPDALHSEVQMAFNLNNLNAYYLATVRKEGAQEAPSYLTAVATPEPQQPGRLLHATATGADRLQRRRLLQLGHGMPNFEVAPLVAQLFSSMQSTDGASAPVTESGSRRISGTGGPAVLADTTSSRIAVAPAPSRGAEASAASTAVIASRTGATAISTSTTSTPEAETLQDMICAAAPFNPSGLSGVLADPSTCPLQTRPAYYSRGEIVFTPVKLPVVFHVLRFPANIPAYSFMSTDTPQAPLGSTTRASVFPPLWNENDNSKAGQNLVDVANNLFENTGIQFSLQEVRTDTTKYPYLVQPSKDAWLNCTHNAAATAQGIACLAGIAGSTDVAPLITRDYVVNVFISGSDGKRDLTYCSRTAAQPRPVCATTSKGYTAAQGPWFLRQSNSAWSESNPATNWIFMTYESFDVRGDNDAAHWNGGGASLAHELGHYLGLLHTHEGSPECLPGPMQGDAVVDTPANIEIGEWKLPAGVAHLAGWCSDFRSGKQPTASQLTQYHSCMGQPVDNVFNVMSYIPDSCVMIFSPGQVARMQWAVAKYRPDMMRAHALL